MPTSHIKLCFQPLYQLPKFALISNDRSTRIPAAILTYSRHKTPLFYIILLTHFWRRAGGENKWYKWFLFFISICTFKCKLRLSFRTRDSLRCHSYLHGCSIIFLYFFYSFLKQLKQWNNHQKGSTLGITLSCPYLIIIIFYVI